MKVSFDLDGTAWKYRDLFSELAHALVARAHEVGILTGHEDETDNHKGIRQADLHLWKARGFPEASFLLNATDCRRAGIPWHGVGQREWKAELARRSGVALHIDDWGTNDRIEFMPITQADQTKE